MPFKDKRGYFKELLKEKTKKSFHLVMSFSKKCNSRYYFKKKILKKI